MCAAEDLEQDRYRRRDEAGVVDEEVCAILSKTGQQPFASDEMTGAYEGEVKIDRLVNAALGAGPGLLREPTG